MELGVVFVGVNNGGTGQREPAMLLTRDSMRYLRILFITMLLTGFLALPAIPDDGPEKPPDGADGAGLGGGGDADGAGQAQSGLPAKIEASIKKGVEWLKAQQQADGSFTMEPRPFVCQGGYTFPTGATALCLFALLKGGVPVNDPCIQKGFEFIRNFSTDNGIVKIVKRLASHKLQ